MPQWLVVEVGPQRGEDSNPGVSVGGGLSQCCQEGIRPGGGRLGEQFLELIDDHEEAGLLAGEQCGSGGRDTLRCQTLQHARRRVDGNAEQCVLERLERMSARRHRHNEPSVRPDEASGPQCRDHPGPDNARLSAAAGPDEVDHVGLGTGVPEAAEEPFDQPLAAEERRRILLGERPQTVIRVDHLDGRRHRASVFRDLGQPAGEDAGRLRRIGFA